MKGRAALAGAVVVVASLGWAAAGATGATGPSGAVRSTGGVDAIDALGPRLAAVAARHGWTPAHLRTELARDATLRFDGTDGLYYEDPTSAARGGASTSAVVSLQSFAVPQPLASTFLLHSKAGSPRVIYLDFDGHTTSGTPWNTGRASSIVSAPYDFDGGASVMTDLEKERIQYIWARVADDYAPMDVDVTTQDPGLEALRKTSSSDANYGVRIVISDTNWYNLNAGGVAYIGSFNWGTDTPAFVFADQLGNGHEKYVAEAVSHEAGHTVGLSHDGTASVGYYAGQGNWAPIMGVGYYEPIVQWSKGEYSGSNNLEDDLAVMAGFGVSVRPDDAGDSRATAAAMSGNGPFTASGRIERRTDVDVFSFTTTGGFMTMAVVPTNPHEPTLDAQARLIDSNGTVLGTSNPASVGAPSLSNTLQAGTYYVEVDGVGEGSPATTGYSDYASLGEYDVTVDAPNLVGLAPVAVAAATPTSGTAPLTVTYSSAGSTDPDGTIAGYAWTFSDGTTSTDPDPVKVYTVAGTYTATLTVTDDLGNRGSAAAPSVVVNRPVLTVTVSSVTVTSVGGRKGRATIVVKTTGGAVVAGATVTGTWSGVLSGTQSATTNASGTATVTSAKGKAGTATFTVTKVVVPSGYVWDGVTKSASGSIS